MHFAALKSLCSGYRAVVGVLDGGITGKEKEAEPTSGFRRRHPLDYAGNGPPGGLRVSEYWPIASWFRPLIPEALPADVLEVVYLDCDSLVEARPAGLWEQETGGNYLLAAQSSLGTMSKSHTAKHPQLTE